MSKAAESSASPPPDWPALADELYELFCWKAPLQPKLAREREIRELFQAKHKNSPAEQSYTIDGHRSTVVISACTNETTVDVPQAFKAVGKAACLKLATITQAALKRFGLTEEQITGMVKVARTGYRKVTAVGKQAA